MVFAVISERYFLPLNYAVIEKWQRLLLYWNCRQRFFEDVGEFKMRSQRDPLKAVRFLGLVRSQIL